jgi:hypothetical protein
MEITFTECRGRGLLLLARRSSSITSSRRGALSQVASERKEGKGEYVHAETTAANARGMEG